MNSKPIHLKRSHTFILNGEIDSLFKLFTPEGERLWVEDWNPDFYFPEDEQTCEGTVFVTESQDSKTIWTCVEFDTNNYFVKYVRTTIGSDTAIVKVRCKEISSIEIEIEVTYEFTSLSEKGNEYLKVYTEEYYKEYINSWGREINRYLENQNITA